MPTSPALSRLLDVGWCLLIPLMAMMAYFAFGVVVVESIHDSIVATAVLGVSTCAIIALLRYRRPMWFTYGQHLGTIGRRLPMVLAVGGGTVLAFIAGQALALWLYLAIGSTGFDASNQTRHASGLIAVLVMTFVAAPAGEEALFRGLIYPLLRRRVGIIVSVAITSGGFALVHGNLVQITSALPLAVLLAVLYEHTRRLWPCIMVHMAFNVAATLIPAQTLLPLANPVTAGLLVMAFTVMIMKLVKNWVPVPVLRTPPGEMASQE